MPSRSPIPSPFVSWKGGGTPIETAFFHHGSASTRAGRAEDQAQNMGFWGGSRRREGDGRMYPCILATAPMSSEVRNPPRHSPEKSSPSAIIHTSVMTKTPIIRRDHHPSRDSPKNHPSVPWRAGLQVQARRSCWPPCWYCALWARNATHLGSCLLNPPCWYPPVGSHLAEAVPVGIRPVGTALARLCLLVSRPADIRLAELCLPDPPATGSRLAAGIRPSAGAVPKAGVMGEVVLAVDFQCRWVVWDRSVSYQALGWWRR